MLFEVRMVRGEGADREERTVAVEADGATMAYVAAMKSSNASEMWTPVGWKEAGGQEARETRSGAESCGKEAGL